MELRTYFVETWGCQMNVLDSQHLGGLLQARGLAPVSALAEADLALLNTCAVREKAVQKVLSRLGELRIMRQRCGRPQVVGLCGCVGEQEGGRLLARSSVLSFVLGPGRMSELGDALDIVAAGERRSFTGFAESLDYDSRLIARDRGARQLITIIQGCNQHCSFCIVPHTRGHEISRPLREVAEEASWLVEGGAKEITLLGQTINAYRCPESRADFADLLAELTAIDQLWRLQFVTSHPRFFSEKMVEKMSRLTKLGSYLHLPLQAGSDAVLKRMRRGYKSAGYLDLARRLRQALPGVTLSTDVIVGFPGETEEELEDTLSLVDEVRFGQLYGFAFSPRPGTPAAHYQGRVSREAAGDRLERVFAVQNAIQLELNQALIGRRPEVLVDGPAKRGAGMWQGRGADNRVVNFPGWPGISPGELAIVTITGATPHALLGERWNGGASAPGCA